MKKIMILYIVLNLVCMSALSAPHDAAYLTSSRYTLSILINSIKNIFPGNADIGASSDNQSGDSKEEIKVRHLSDVAAAVAVVDSIVNCTYNGDDALKMTYYINGSFDKKECYFDSDSISEGGAFLYDDLTPGSLVYVGLDKQQVVQNYCVLAVLDKDGGIPQVDTTAASLLNPDKIKISYSYILDFGYSNGDLDIELTNGEYLSVPSDSFMYTVEPKRNSVRIYTDSCTSGDVYSAEYDDALGQTVVYPVVSVAYRGEAVFTCAYSTAVYIDGDITE